MGRLIEGALVDRLRYDYAIWGNVLASVHDTLLTATPDFQLPGTTHYKYDNNGNVTGRTNGGSTGNDIDTIICNHLNLPQQVTAVAGNVTYVYDGTGRKLRSINAANGQTRDYIDGIEYVGNTTQPSYRELEIGVRTINAAQLGAIADFLRIPVNHFYREDLDPQAEHYTDEAQLKQLKEQLETCKSTLRIHISRNEELEAKIKRKDRKIEELLSRSIQL